MSFALRYARTADERALRTLWEICFPGDELFTDYFFRTLFRPEHALVSVYNDAPVAMLHMLPYRFRWRGQSVPLAYHYGIGTHPDYRNRGLSRGLMEQALFEMHLHGVSLAALIPERAELFPFYEKFGFAPVFRRPCEYDFNDENAITAGTTHIGLLNGIYESALASTPHIQRDEAVWQGILEECALSGGRVRLSEEKASYAVDNGRGITEAFGPATNRSAQSRSFGCMRVVEAGAAAAAAGLSVHVLDSLAPWNSGWWGGAGKEQSSGQPLTPNELAEHLFANGAPPYMSLMHN